MTKQISMPNYIRKHLKSEMFNKEICGFQIIEVLGVGNTAITYRVEDEFNFQWALKFVMCESYGNKAPLREIGRFSKTTDDRYLVFPKETGEWQLQLRGKTYDFIWFKSKCVNGKILKDFLESGQQFSIKKEITTYIENITIALEELHRLKFCHGDLHDGNIMREEIGGEGLLPEVRYVIIDFSEAYPIDATNEGLSEDIKNFGHHLRSFSDVIYKKDTTREDEKILTAISHIPGLLNGEASEAMGISKASQVMERFKDALNQAEKAPRKLIDPFHPINSENIANEALLADLCFTKMWWTSECEKNSNILLIGPRGCGKTMIFRRLRFKTKLAANREDEINSDQYVGFYLPFESLFYMRFSDLSEVNIENNKLALITYFNMTALAEVVTTLAISSNIIEISQGIIVALTKLFKEEVGSIWQELEFPSIVTNLDEINTFAENILRHIRKSISYSEQISTLGSNDFISRLVKIVKRHVPLFADRNFIFFLDDYTEERIPLALQEILHPIVCQRSSELCFKISAHMFGSIYNSPRPLALDEGRNITVIDLGSAYLKLNRRNTEGKLLLNILNERFKNCDNYKGRIENWLGKTTYPGGRTLSHALHSKSTRSNVNYHGTKCIMELCTGDYSEMIRMVGEIFSEVNIEPGSPVRIIPPSKQDKAIRRVSREYLGRIRHIRPDGEKLFDVLDSFGTLSKKLLCDKELIGQGKDSKGNQRKDPFDLLTIYIDDLTKAQESARKVWERLQKASIFVNIGLASSQRNVISDRATLRRIYCPSFGTTLSSSEHLQATKGQFEWFMDQPKEFCESQFQKRVRKQSTLWSEEDSVIEDDDQEEARFSHLPKEKDRKEMNHQIYNKWEELLPTLPEVNPLVKVINKNST